MSDVVEDVGDALTEGASSIARTGRKLTSGDPLGFAEDIVKFAVDPFDILSKVNQEIRRPFEQGAGPGVDVGVNLGGATRPAPNLSNQAIIDALLLARGKRGAASGRQSTIRTGPLGLTNLAPGQGAELIGVR